MFGVAELIGFAAAFCTTIAGLPQVIKIFKTKKAEDISLGLILLFILGVSLWLIYGILILSLPIIFANFFTLLIWFALLGFKLKYR